MGFCLTPDGLHFGKEEGVPAVRVEASLKEVGRLLYPSLLFSSGSLHTKIVNSSCCNLFEAATATPVVV